MNTKIEINPKQDLTKYIKENVRDLTQEYIEQLWLDYSSNGCIRGGVWKRFYDSDGGHAADTLWQAGHLARKTLGDTVSRSSYGFMTLDDYNEIKGAQE